MTNTTTTTDDVLNYMLKHHERRRRMDQLKNQLQDSRAKKMRLADIQKRKKVEGQRRVLEAHARRVRDKIVAAFEEEDEKNKKNNNAGAVLDAPAINLADFWIEMAWDAEHGQFGLERDLEEDGEQPASAWFMELINAAPNQDDVRRSARVVRRVPGRMLL